MAQPHISLAAEKIGTLLGLPVTNSTLMTWMVMIVLVVFAYFATRTKSRLPSNIQSIAEVVLDGIYSLFKSVVGEKHIDTFFPVLATIFLFVITANWFGLLPGVGTIGFTKTESTSQSYESAQGVEEKETAEPVVIEDDHGASLPAETEEGTSTAEIDHSQGEGVAEAGHTSFVPLFRGATADLNTTLAIALIAVFSVQYYGIKTLGGSYLKKFFNFSDPIMFGVGLLEIVSEFSRIISFAFRLFGNIFAGEVLLTVIAFLMPLIAPLPFLGLELFVGFIQALVFSMLTAVFLNMATISHEAHAEH